MKECPGQYLQNKFLQPCIIPCREIFLLQRQPINQGPYLRKIKYSCLNQNLIFKISSFFQIKGRNSVLFDKIKRFAIP